jgi:hypothetical protein
MYANFEFPGRPIPTYTDDPPKTIKIGYTDVICPRKIDPTGVITPKEYMQQINRFSAGYAGSNSSAYQRDFQPANPSRLSDVTYCGSRQDLTYATIYNTCYGDDIAQQTPYRYQRMGTGLECLNKGNQLGRASTYTVAPPPSNPPPDGASASTDTQQQSPVPEIESSSSRSKRGRRREVGQIQPESSAISTSQMVLRPRRVARVRR